MILLLFPSNKPKNVQCLEGVYVYGIHLRHFSTSRTFKYGLYRNRTMRLSSLDMVISMFPCVGDVDVFVGANISLVLVQTVK